MIVGKHITVAPKTTKGTSFATVNYDAIDKKDQDSMPKNGSGDNFSTLSQSPPLILDGE